MFTLFIFLVVCFIVGYILLKLFKVIMNAFKKKAPQEKKVELKINKTDFKKEKLKQSQNITVSQANNLSHIILKEKPKDNSGSHANKSDLIRLELNRIEVDDKGFNVFFNTHNIVNKIIHFAIIESYYVTKEKEQIKSGRYDILNIGDVSEIVTREVLPNLNVLRYVKFKSNYRDFNTDDLIMIEYYVDENRFYLAEKLEFIKNKEIKMIL